MTALLVAIVFIILIIAIVLLIIKTKHNGSGPISDRQDFAEQLFLIPLAIPGALVTISQTESLITINNKKFNVIFGPPITINNFIVPDTDILKILKLFTDPNRPKVGLCKWLFKYDKKHHTYKNHYDQIMQADKTSTNMITFFDTDLSVDSDLEGTIDDTVGEANKDLFDYIFYLDYNLEDSKYNNTDIVKMTNNFYKMIKPGGKMLIGKLDNVYAELLYNKFAIEKEQKIERGYVGIGLVPGSIPEIYLNRQYLLITKS